MALLTADDVFNKKFQPTRLREGYDQDEVDDFLDEVVNTLRVLQTENEDLRRKLGAAEKRVAEVSRNKPATPEQTPAPTPVAATPTPAPRPAPTPVAVPDASTRAAEPEAATGMLVLAQKLHDEYVNNGQAEHDRIVNEAKTRASQLVRDAETQSSQIMQKLEQDRTLLERKIDELRVYERDYHTRLKSYLEDLLTKLEVKAPTLPPRATSIPAQPGTSAG